MTYIDLNTKNMYNTVKLYLKTTERSRLIISAVVSWIWMKKKKQKQKK
jgi:hypothetical protein